MILFEDDWELYPHAIVDYETKNESFLRYSLLLREMGIKNHLWPLQLHDAGLQGVDPFDPNITPDLAVRIAIECKTNFFYFIREVARDPAGSDDFPISFKANRGIMATYWLFFNHILVILVLVRQVGKSFGLDWLYTFLLNLRVTKTDISVLTKDEKLRGRELERLKGMELALPSYLKQRSTRDPGNTEVFKIGALQNFLKLYLPNKSPKLADMVGRGMTSPIIGVDEFAYLHNNWITIPVMLTTAGAAREISRLKNEPYGTVFSTTSGKRDTPEGRYAYRLTSDAAIWSEGFYDTRNLAELEETIKKASPGKKLHVNCTFNHRQLGKTDDWLKGRLAEAIQEDPVAIRADFLNEWPSGSTTTPFDQALAEGIRLSELLDYYTQFAPPEAYALRWYYKEEDIQQKMQVPHVLSIDPSEAVNRDAIGIVLRNAITGEVAMAADISEGNLILFSKWICMFLKEFLTVTAIIERRSSGAMILDYLLLYLPAAGLCPFKRLYNRVVQDAEDFPERFREIQNPNATRENIYMKYKKFFGWSTSGTGATSRTDLYSKTLNNAAKMTGRQIRDRKLILQILGLEVKNGRVDHGDGEHDDLVIAWLLSYWLLSMGKNLHHYGIDPSKIMSENPSYREQLKVVSAYEQNRQSQARLDVERITEQLKTEREEYLARRLEYDLERAISLLTDQDRQIVSADDLINRLREERSRNARRSYGYYAQ